MVVPVVVVVRMVVRGVAALTGRIGRHSTARLAVVAAASLVVAQLDEGVRHSHPQLGSEGGVVAGPVGKEGSWARSRPRFLTGLWHNANSTTNAVAAPVTGASSTNVYPPPKKYRQDVASGVVPGLVQEFIGQLRAITERLEDLAGSTAGLPSAPGAFPLPGGLSAAQMTSIADSIAAQRRSIAALKAQLSSFDEQLAVLEQILGPLAEWSKTWADLEERLLRIGRRPEAER